MGLKNLFTLLILLIVCPACFGQGILRGKVSSEGAPLEFVNVGVKGTKLGASTDANGSFEIRNIPYGQHKLVVSKFQACGEFFETEK